MENLFLGSAAARLRVHVEKRDNGWTVDLNETPRLEHAPVIGVPAEKDADEILDNVIDAIRAFLSSIHDEDDSWKGGDNREKMRNAVKAIFPGVTMPRFELPPEPRTERRVFTDKAELLKYLGENL